MARKPRLKRLEPPIRAELTLGALALDGSATAEYEGRKVFVDYGMPGERVVAEIDVERPHALFGRVVEVLEAAPGRVEAPCEYFGECGGCQWQHVSYERQLEFKRTLVVEQLQQIGGFEEPPVSATVGAENPWGYRNHVRFTAKSRGEIGFVRRGTHRFLRIDRCLIADDWVNDAIPLVQGRAGGLHQVAIRRGVKTGELLVHPNLDHLGTSIPSGQKYYHEEVLGHRFRISAASFFQTNTLQAERLICLVRDKLELLPSETLVDAYAGVGTFAVVLAGLVKRVIAIEESSAAVDDAAVNTDGMSNIQYHMGKVEDVLGGIDAEMDALILDPPRIGVQPAAIQAVLQKAPGRIAYVSCDPSTLARDLRLLVDGVADGGRYDLVDVTPVDMFPQTHHIECVAILRRV